MAQGKDKKLFETSNKEPLFVDKDFSFQDRLALPADLKKYLNDEGMDYRFLNSSEFRASGNYHRSHWQPFKAPADIVQAGLYGVTADGHVQRGDLILGIRPKALSAKHREHLKQKRSKYSNFAKTEAKRMQQEIRDKGLGDHVRVEEGYDEDDKGYA